jgi:hypothetical protein
VEPRNLRPERKPGLRFCGYHQGGVKIQASAFIAASPHRRHRSMLFRPLRARSAALIPAMESGSSSALMLGTSIDGSAPGISSRCTRADRKGRTVGGEPTHISDSPIRGALGGIGSDPENAGIAYYARGPKLPRAAACT